MAPLIIAERRIIFFLVSYGRISDFLLKMVVFRLAEASELGSYQACGTMYRHKLGIGQSITNVTKGAVYLPFVMTAKQLLSSQR